jgi:hypothetical protein
MTPLYSITQLEFKVSIFFEDKLRLFCNEIAEDKMICTEIDSDFYSAYEEDSKRFDFIDNLFQIFC